MKWDEQMSLKIQLTKTDKMKQNLNSHRSTNKIEFDYYQKPSHKENSKSRWYHWWIVVNIPLRININVKQILSVNKGTHPNLFSETIIIVIMKPDKDITTKENYKAISFMNIPKSLTLNIKSIILCDHMKLT